MHYICEDVQYGGGLSIAIHVHVYDTYRYNQAVLMVYTKSISLYIILFAVMSIIGRHCPI